MERGRKLALMGNEHYMQQQQLKSKLCVERNENSKLILRVMQICAMYVV